MGTGICGAVFARVIELFEYLGRGEKTMQKRVKFGVGVGIIVATVSALAVVGYREQPTYYHTIRELPNLKPSDATVCRTPLFFAVLVLSKTMNRC